MLAHFDLLLELLFLKADLHIFLLETLHLVLQPRDLQLPLLLTRQNLIDLRLPFRQEIPLLLVGDVSFFELLE